MFTYETEKKQFCLYNGSFFKHDHIYTAVYTAWPTHTGKSFTNLLPTQLQQTDKTETGIVRKATYKPDL